MTMTGAQFRRRRERFGKSQTEAAEELGLARRTIQYYEENPDRLVPRVTELACLYLDMVAQAKQAPADDQADALGKLMEAAALLAPKVETRRRRRKSSRQ